MAKRAVEDRGKFDRLSDMPAPRRTTDGVGKQHLTYRLATSHTSLTRCLGWLPTLTVNGASFRSPASLAAPRACNAAVVERREAGLDVIHRANLRLLAGACQHPDGVVRFITGALRVFEADFRDHGRHGRCERCSRPALLPAPTGERACVSA